LVIMNRICDVSNLIRMSLLLCSGDRIAAVCNQNSER
jgi:hypothetical protein